jgi:hypothetical protein
VSVWTALEARYCAPEWAYFEQVRNGTGYSRAVVRTADALAFSLYPSRGLELHGFEVKTSRGDWLREKRDPEKAEEIGKFCERWWLVTTSGVVADVGEIPSAWGWLEWTGKKWLTRKPAPPRGAQPLDKLMIAAILRRAGEGEHARFSEAVTINVNERMKEERETGAEVQAKLTQKIETLQSEATRFRSLLHQVEQALGTEILEKGWGNDAKTTKLPDELVERLKLFTQADLVDLRRDLTAAADSLKRAATGARWSLRRAGIRPTKHLGGFRG